MKLYAMQNNNQAADTYRSATYDLLLTFHSNSGSILCRFRDIQCWKISWPWNPGQRSLKVIECGIFR